ncbi:MAG: hypothetical protein PVH88_06375 [Ignavibacteria bacterium]|jgi:hypothetical protein
MKNIMMLLFCLFSLKINNYSQVLTQQDKERIINALNDESASTRLGVLFNIEEFQITEAEDSLIQKIWSDSLDMQLHYLTALYAINSSVTYDYTIDYIVSLDSVSTSPELAEYWLEYKVRATGILFNYGNYQNVDLVFDLIARDKPDVNIFVIPFLKEIILDLPSYETQAKTELMYAAENGYLHSIKNRATSDLIDLYGFELFDYFKNLIISDSTFAVSQLIMNRLFNNYRNEEVNTFLRERIINESNLMHRYAFVLKLVELFGFPNDLMTLKEVVEQEADSSERNLINFEVRNFKCLKPDSTVSETEMIDSLISYNHQSYSFGWIPDTLTYDTLSLKLSLIATDIDTELWTDALNKTNDYLLYVENALTLNAINDDAYKFLRYYGEYIKERLGLWQQ